jgi:DNA polymerase-3 subunit delta
MAKKASTGIRYREEVAALRAEGPARLYLLYGPEDYLRERFLAELRQVCVPAEDEFSYRRMDGQQLDLNALAEAVNALPFFSERTLVEVRDYDINRCRESDAEALKTVLGDIPDWCTVAFVCAADYAPDGRLAAVKLLKKAGRVLEFTEQEGSALTQWAVKRFAALGKGVARADVEYLIFLCGSRMNALLPEIEKAAAYAAGETVTRADIDATANRLPEADVFRMVDLLSRRQPDRAAALLRDLLSDRDNHPIALTALIGTQMRRLYALKLCREAGKPRAEAMALAGVRFDFLYDNLSAAAAGYTVPQLAAIVALCAEYDYKMKSTGLDPELLLRDLFARIAAGGV